MCSQCSPASAILASIVTILVSFEAILMYLKICGTLKLTFKVDSYRKPPKNCFKTSIVTILANIVEVERAGSQLVFWLELGELSQLGSAQLTILNLLASSAQLSSPF